MLLVLSAITLLTLDFRGFGPLDTVQRGFRNVFAPVRSGIEMVLSPATDAGHGIFDYGSLKDENRRLREEIDALKGAQLQSEVDRETLKRLLAQINSEYVGNYPRVVARVVAGSIGNFDEYSVEIDKGSNAGLVKDMPVVTSAGLVGRLVEVYATRSRMQLITSPQFAVGVRVGQEVSLAKGTGSGNPLSAKASIPIDAPVQVGGWRKRDRVDEEVEMAPAPPDLGEDRLDLAACLDVEGQQERGPEFRGQGLHVGSGLVVQEGERQLRPGHPRGRSAAPRDAVAVGDAHDAAFLSPEIGHRCLPGADTRPRHLRTRSNTGSQYRV